jgi:predicted SnoaL-like aldol condensation-catalyzing enzyme
MKAIYLTAYGNPAQNLKMVEVSEPNAPSASEALVRMRPASLLRRLPTCSGQQRRTQPMEKTLQEKNKATVLKAFDTLFNKRDYAVAEKFWSPDYIQHSAHIEPGREGLFNLVKRLPQTLKYEPGTIVADGDFVIVHGRFSGFLPVNWIAADILRIKDGVLVEHWDVIQDEATQDESKSKAPMFGTSFPRYPDRKQL